MEPEHQPAKALVEFRIDVWKGQSEMRCDGGHQQQARNGSKHNTSKAAALAADKPAHCEAGDGTGKRLPVGRCPPFKEEQVAGEPEQDHARDCESQPEEQRFQ